MEYRLRFKYSDAVAVEKALAQPPIVRDNDQRVFEFRSADCIGAMPNAEAHVISEGLYFCDYGDGLAFLGNVVAKLVSEFGSVTVEDLE